MSNPILILIGLTVLVSAYALSKPAFMDVWILEPALMARRGQWYRFLTSGFLHADWGHLLFNMFAFYSFSPVVLGALAGNFGQLPGLGWFLLLYLGGIVLSDVPTYYRHRRDPNYRSLGASGGVSAVVFASILLFPVAPGGGGIIIFPIPFPIQPFLFGVLYLFYSWYQGRRQGDNINHDAHFYGALFGVLLMVALLPATAPQFFTQVKLFIYSKF